jgi:hypothetical protein
MGDGIYIASKAKHGPRWQDLRREGVPIISTWIDESGEGETEDWGALWARSINEASDAAALVVYNEPGERMKGALTEIGAALAHDVQVFWVGPTVDPDGKEYTVVRHPLVTRCVSLQHALNRAESLANSRGAMSERPESGPMAFGEDWPGVFLRGDHAAPSAMYLSMLLDCLAEGKRPSSNLTLPLRTLVHTLSGCDTRGNLDGLQHLRPWAECVAPTGQLRNSSVGGAAPVVTVPGPEVSAPISPEQFAAYLISKGWEKYSEDQCHHWFERDGHSTAVPQRCDFRDYARRCSEEIRDLAGIEERSAHEVLRAIADMSVEDPW